MNDYLILSSILVALVVGWILYQKIRTNPEVFQARVLQEASFSLAFLAIFLIAVVGFFVVTL